jgi:LCP family protein required for cell wall assembly
MPDRVPNKDENENVNPSNLPDRFDPSQIDAVKQAYSGTPRPVFSRAPKITSKEKIDIPLHSPKKKNWRWWVLVITVLLMFFTPVRTTVLILGIDRPPEGTWQGRSDTMMLASLPPGLPQFSILSIPRDLWVTIPGQSDNRINAAHYFAEINNNDGMKAAAEVVEVNLGVKVNYVVRIKFDGFVKVIDSMGGVTIDLPLDMSGLTAGKHHLDGTQALAFVRDRAGSDDFWRQKRGQMLLTAVVKGVLNPIKWGRLPAVFVTAAQSIETNIPFWVWPRLTYSALFSAVKGFDSHTLDREMVTPWTTDLGAQVLLPNWELINPLLMQLFKQ